MKKDNAPKPALKLDIEMKKFRSEHNHKNPIRELESRLSDYAHIPKKGWINRIRKGLCMSLKQMAARIEEPVINSEYGEIVGYNKKPVTPQAIAEFERCEADGTISLNSMRKMARALEMEFRYSLTPMYYSVTAMVEDKAEHKVMRFYNREENKAVLEEFKKYDKTNDYGEVTNKERDKFLHNKKMELITFHLKTLWDLED